LIYGSAAQGALLYATIPAVVGVCAVLFLKERLRRRRILGITLSVAGAALLVAMGEARADDAPAPLLAAADQTAVTFAMSALGALLLLPTSALELAGRPWPITSAGGWLGVVYLAV